MIWDPQAALMATIGGALIGLASLALMAFSGRIAGISGIVGGLLNRNQAGDYGWRFMFLLGLILGGALMGFVYPSAFPAAIEAGPAPLVVAGLLVGFGTRLGSGCTSGHGVCGMSRLSPRSIAATLTFMATGAVTVFIMRHVLTGA